MNARDICSEVYHLSGFGDVSSYQNGDIDDKLIFALLRRVARDIAKYRWQELLREGLIHIVGGNDSYNMPIDFRELIPNSMRAIDDLRSIDFPAPIETWAIISSNTGATGTRHRLRFQDGKLVKPSQEKAIILSGSITSVIFRLLPHPIPIQIQIPVSRLLNLMMIYGCWMRI